MTISASSGCGLRSSNRSRTSAGRWTARRTRPASCGRDYLLDASVTRGDLAVWFQQMKRPDDALRVSAEGIEGLEKLVAADPASRKYRGQLGLYLNNRAAFLAQGGRLKEAEPVFRRVVELYESLVAGPEAELGHRSLLARSTYNLAKLLMDHGAPVEGEKHLRRAVALNRELARDYPQVPGYHVRLGATLDKLAFALRDRGEAAEAIQCWDEALTHQRLLLEAEPDNAAARETLGVRYWNVADGRLLLGHHREAALAAAEMPALFPDHSQGSYQAARVHTRCVVLAEQDAKLSTPEKAELVAGYGGRALQFLAPAVQKGDLKGADLAKDNNFAPLRSLPGFQQLVSDAAPKP
jgi:tetratricopeptide (TPR) repeat protein